MSQGQRPTVDQLVQAGAAARVARLHGQGLLRNQILADLAARFPLAAPATLAGVYTRGRAAFAAAAPFKFGATAPAPLAANVPGTVPGGTGYQYTLWYEVTDTVGGIVRSAMTQINSPVSLDNAQLEAELIAQLEQNTATGTGPQRTLGVGALFTLHDYGTIAITRYRL